MARRPMGSLEESVLKELWTGDPLTPAEVLDRLDGDLAYTTVMTILTRLWKKGLVNRSRSGRAFAYTAAVSEAEFLAARMSRELARTRDREAVLSRFVDDLSDHEVAVLKAMLGVLDEP